MQFESSKVKFVAIISHNNCTLLIEAAKQVLDLTFDLIVQQFDSSKIKFVATISLEIAEWQHVKGCSAKMHSGLVKVT